MIVTHAESNGVIAPDSAIRLPSIKADFAIFNKIGIQKQQIPALLARADALGCGLELYLTWLYKDYSFFITEIWLFKRLSRYHMLGDGELDIARYAQHGPKRRGMLAPRSIGKTHFVTCGYTCWCLFRNASHRIIIVSKSDGFARKIVKQIRGWIDTVPFLQHLKPRPQIKGGRIWRDNLNQFDAGPSEDGKDPSVSAIGIDGQLEGTRAHTVIADDVETPKNTITREARDELDDRVKEFANVLYNDDPNAEILYVGTYHHEESLYVKLAGRGYSFRTWPVLFPHEDEQVMNLAPMLSKRMEAGEAKAGDIVYPHRHDRTTIAEKMAEGRRNFAMQQMLIANMGDTTLYPLRLADLITFLPLDRDIAPVKIVWGTNHGQGQSTAVNDIPVDALGRDCLYGPVMFDSTWMPYQSTAAWIDPAGEGSDKTAVAIVALAHGRLWAKHVEGFPNGSRPEGLHAIAKLLRDHRATYCAVEKFALQSYYRQLLDPVVQAYRIKPGEDPNDPDGWACSVEMVAPPATQKELRIIGALDPLMASHRLVISEQVARNRSLQHQMTRITRQRNCLDHEDELEALANCCWLFEDQLAISTENAEQMARDRLIDQQLEEHRRLCGFPPRNQNWILHYGKN